MQAMKVENMVKLKEEFDYKSLCRRLETELDRMIAENERLVKIREDTEDECVRQLDDARQDVYEAESKLAHALEVCKVIVVSDIHYFMASEGQFGSVVVPARLIRTQPELVYISQAWFGKSVISILLLRFWFIYIGLEFWFWFVAIKH